MREGRRLRIPTVLVLTVIAVAMFSFAAAAASGLPATITMRPASAGPGSVVEVVGLDFPAEQAVELQLTTTAGPVHLATAMTEAGGYFRQRVTMPRDVEPGFWELRATAANGVAAAQIFEASAPAAVVAPDAEAAGTNEAPVAAGTSSGANLLVMFVLLFTFGAIALAATFVYYKVHHPEIDPGMSSAEDPIWGGAPTDQYTHAGDVPRTPGSDPFKVSG
jgi:hypothetical protein